jgi:hypothetical protein
MSTITTHVITPTLDLSLEVTPQSGTITGYDVVLTPDGGSPVTVENVPFTAHGGKHYLQRCAEINVRTGDFSVTVAAVIGGVTQTASAAYPFTVAVQTSRPATARQRIFELIQAAGITYGGESLNVHGDVWGRPRVLRDMKPTGYRGPVCDVGVAHATGETNDTDVLAIQTVSLPVRVWAKGDDADEMENAVNIAEAVRAKVYALSLTDMGLSDLGWSWAIEPPRAVEGGKMHVVEMRVTLPPWMCARGTHLI